MTRRTQIIIGVLAVGLLVLGAAEVWAQVGGAWPWEQPLTGIAASLTGPVARNAFIIGVVIFGIMWWAGFSIVTSGIGLVVGGAIVANAPLIAQTIGFR